MNLISLFSALKSIIKALYEHIESDNIKNVKDHVFYNEHDLDRYGPDEIEHKRFDATLEQALAWKLEFIHKTMLLGSSMNVVSDITN